MSIKEGIRQTEKGYELLQEANKTMTDAMYHAYLFTWQWWLGIALFVTPWIFWFFFRKKESTGRLLMGAFATIILSLLTDLIATSYGWWSYPIKFSPISPELFLPYHLSLVPIAVMVVLQIKPRANPFLKGAIFAAVGAFGGMKVFEALRYYDPKGTPMIYVFFIFLVIYLISYVFYNMNNFQKVTSRSEPLHEK
ncbi:CBO0543 family protein [Oceanobacillus kapialis]|uniref:CBO0543 family protein n=1 Tax=Oceanobacillus kapialis TaxID=481353 RepID=UPI00384CC0DA